MAAGPLVQELRDRFENISEQHKVEGCFCLKIGLDIENGAVGVEVKLASELLSCTNAQGLIGQAVYYQKRGYGNNLIVAVIGMRNELREPVVKETLGILKELGITTAEIEARD